MTKKEKDIIAEQYTYYTAMGMMVENYISDYGKDTDKLMTTERVQYWFSLASAIYDTIIKCNLEDYLLEYYNEHICDMMERVKAQNTVF